VYHECYALLNKAIMASSKNGFRVDGTIYHPVLWSIIVDYVEAVTMCNIVYGRYVIL